jgi:hypothetical protein
MHAAVITSDEKVLLTERAPKVDYYPKIWSVSVEEQLTEADLIPGNRGAVLRCGRRLLYEELGIEEVDYHTPNLRVLAVFLEAHILNCSLAAIFPLILSSEELANRLKAKPRTDYEFCNWTFLSFSELTKELIRPTRPLHPTSGYRMLLALAWHFGVPRLVQILPRA